MDDLAKVIVWRWCLQCCHWTFCGEAEDSERRAVHWELFLQNSFSYWNNRGSWDRHQYWTSGIFWSTVLCGGHRKMSQLRHILRGLGRIIRLLEKGEKSTFWLPRGTNPCRKQLSQACCVGRSSSLGSWEAGAAHLGHMVCKHPLVLCSTISLLGKWFVSFSIFCL